MNTKRVLFVVVAVGVLIILIAAGGMLHTSKKMNDTADSQPGMSAGRSGDPRPNGIQEQQLDQSARNSKTTGANPDSSAPPAR